MKRVLLVLLVLFAVPVALGVPQPPHEFYGVITDEDSGDAAEDIAVESRISGSTISSDATDSDGEYTLQVPSDRSGETVDIYVDGSQEEAYTVQVGATTNLDVEGAYIDDDDGGGGGETITSSDDEEESEPKEASFEQTSETSQSAEVGDVSEGQTVTTTTSSDDSDNTVRSVSFSSSSDGDDVSVTVEEKDNQSPERTKPADQVYSYRNITVNGLPDEAITQANVTFRVQKTWLDDQEATADSVTLQRLVDGEWQRLDTQQTRETQTYVQYVSETPGFSLYAITADTTSDDQEQQGEQQPEEPTGEPSFSVQDFNVEPREGPRPLDTTIDVTVVNDGDADGTYTVDVRDDATTIRSETVGLSPGDTASRTYQVTLNETGTHTIQVDDRARAILVNPAPGENTALFIAIAVIVALGLIYGYVRDRYPKLP